MANTRSTPLSTRAFTLLSEKPSATARTVCDRTREENFGGLTEQQSPSAGCELDGGDKKWRRLHYIPWVPEVFKDEDDAR